MYISEIKLENFRCFSGNHELVFKPGINYLVGNNNCGKTTIFRAIEFLQSAKNKEDWITKGKENEDISVEIKFKGEDLNEILDQDSLSKYAKYVYNNELIVRRSSRRTTWTDSKNKEKEIGIKNVALYNKEERKYENPTGIDKTINALFETQFVWSDIDNEDYQDFNKTKILGRIIHALAEHFNQTDSWKQLVTAHEEAFGDGGFSAELRDVESKIEEVMSNQYGETKVEIGFDLPDIDSFLKIGQIQLEDNGIRTEANQKGTGMQRALALNLIQVYSSISSENSDKLRPIFFFLDEPETFLHPKAQDKLLDSLEELSKRSQIFITTHSPYLLRNYNSKNDDLKIFSRDKNKPRIRDDVDLNLFNYSPTWGEINYFAFEIPSIEFHNELFGFLHQKAADKEPKRVTIRKIKSFDAYLESINGSVKTDENHVNSNGKYENRDRVMTTYIRNWFDHPGLVEKREKPTIQDMKESIEFMLEVNKKL